MIRKNVDVIGAVALLLAVSAFAGVSSNMACSRMAAGSLWMPSQLCRVLTGAPATPRIHFLK